MLRRTLLTIAVSAIAAPAPAQLSLTQVGNSFTQPLFVTAAPGDTDPNRLFVVEKGGTVRTFIANTTTPGAPSSTFLNLPSILGAGQLLTGGEQGLLGMAFGPGFANGNGFVYVDYVGSNGTTQGETRIDRFTVTNGTVDTGSRANVLTFAQNVAGATNHKGGWIGFGPDSSLYIATGDGGSANDPAANAQNRSVLLGKMLRINPSTGAGGGYTIPATNPFVGNTSGFREEIFAYGLRNPFRNSFDRATGNFYIGDVGQGQREEVNFVAAGSTGGQNFGWRRFEGNIQTPGINDTTPTAAEVTFPIHEYPHTNGNASITGGYVYRSGDIVDNGQSLDGTYIFGDFVSGRVFSFRYNGLTMSNFIDRTTEMNSLGVVGGNSLASFGEDNLGRLYAVDIGGQVYRITGLPVPEPATLAWCRRRGRLPVVAEADGREGEGTDWGSLSDVSAVMVNPPMQRNGASLSRRSAAPRNHQDWQSSGYSVGGCPPDGHVFWIQDDGRLSDEHSFVSDAGEPMTYIGQFVRLPDIEIRDCGIADILFSPRRAETAMYPQWFQPIPASSA